ncbi:MAG: cytochrome c1 protein [Betaproteobacteria bacterium]|nr:cytochrome c1 protein [Betaproteobacteria bacterium]
MLHSGAQLRRWLFGLAALSSLGFMATPAHAVPAYARQTGQDCIACHVGGFGPQLTPFGRAFKLGGYTLQGGSEKHNIPLSAMLVASYTHTTDNIQTSQNFSANDNFTALQQASVFVAGRLTDHIGVFGQATYADPSDPGNDRVMWDNTDLRYANDYQFGSTSGIFGVSLNNNPTVSDVWNTVPAWQFGFMSTPFGPGYGPATPMIASLGAAVIGTTAYTLIDNHWYIEGGLYHGISNWWNQQLRAGGAGAVSGYNPYWRLNYSTSSGLSNYEVGLVGMNTKVNDGVGPSNNEFKDYGVDASYQYINGGTNSVTVNGLLMREKQDFTSDYVGAGNSANSSDTLNFLNVNAAYWYENTYGATIQFFNTSGSTDGALYSATNGYTNGNPGTSGVVWELDWNPFGKSWTNPEKNLRLGVQYTTYNKFAGTSQGASGNNSLYVYLWTAI